MEERLEPGTGYRSDADQAVLELTRPPLEALPELPHRRGLTALAAALVSAALPMLWVALDPVYRGEGGMHPALYGALGGLLLTLGVSALVVHLHARHEARRRRRARARERGTEALRVRVDAAGLHASPRRDEPWDGEASASQVARVFADREDAYHRVRVELDDGREVTLLDGVEAREEAETIAARVRARLSRGLPSRP